PVLAAMLILLDGHPADKWSDDDLVRWVAVQRAVLRHRAAELDVASDRARAGQALLDGVLAGGQKWLGVAPSTAHVSVVDTEGFACSVTASSGTSSTVPACTRCPRGSGWRRTWPRAWPAARTGRCSPSAVPAPTGSRR